MRILIIRYGAWGDCVIISPLLRYLKKQGHEIVLETSSTGMKVLQHNPNIDKFIEYEANSVPDEKLEEHWEALRKENECEKFINLCESIERSLSLRPTEPEYFYPKEERRALCDKNFYAHTFEFAYKQAGEPVFGNCELEDEDFLPELFFTEEEETNMRNFFAHDKRAFWILWGLSGSGNNKTYPYTDYVIKDLLQKFPNVKIVTVGDELCQMLEGLKDPRVIRRCGRWSIRDSALACKYVNLVICPDTGLLHSAGCFETPKIGLIGSNTRNNLTRFFKNDFSIEADPEKVPCAPCFYLINASSYQCPIDPVHLLPKCMSVGIDPKKVFERIGEVVNRFSVAHAVPCL